MVEDPWPNTTQKARVSFNVHNDRGQYAVTIGHCSMQLGVWGAVSSPAASGQRPGGGAGGDPEALIYCILQYRKKGF